MTRALRPRDTAVMNDLIPSIQAFLAHQSIGPSVVRNQGGNGLVPRLRSVLAKTDLARFRAAGFEKELDKLTLSLSRALPEAARSWGLARKAANVFLFQTVQNAWLRKRFGLEAVEDRLELPLDSVTAKALCRLSKPRELPPWNGYKALSRHDHARYQAKASEVALARKHARVYLDLDFWR